MEEKLVGLKDAAAGMLSPGYKERFVAEYRQLRARLAKLSDFIAEIKAAKEKGGARAEARPPALGPRGAIQGDGEVSGLA